MYILHKGKPVDFQFDFLRWLTGIFDRKLDELTHEIETNPDAEALGTYENMEELFGLGFVTCQKYLGSVRGHLNFPPKALSHGRKLECGLSVPEAINHAANLWKHRDEWGTANLDHKSRQKTIDGIKRLGVEMEQPYISSNILAILTPLGRFVGVLPDLIDWREELRLAKKKSHE
jgi:hypothetical protein